MILIYYFYLLAFLIDAILMAIVIEIILGSKDLYFAFRYGLMISAFIVMILSAFGGLYVGYYILFF